MNKEHYISVVAEIDPELHQSLSKYLDKHPCWDINKVFNASLSLFMLQNWQGENKIESEDMRTCSRVYLDSIFAEYCTYNYYKKNKL
ncbi:DUF2811 domain-containing protein [Myxosarcina sp. GI1]|uniref:DUF2811 domain-containing protein n=1 Tax=Myxosarcina sp. GI1 TaxID=1541065 RepID=UPI0005659871|nr:DUF2811 domain-containing protein [Myxosarcina sp. GI1]